MMITSRNIIAIALVVLTHTTNTTAGVLTQVEIAQIESAFSITLSEQQKIDLGDIVKPDAIESWRREAGLSIETHRKSGLTVIVKDTNGVPVEGASVAIKLEKNAFRFGGVVTVADLTDDNGNLAVEGSTANDWKNLTTQLFNAVGLNNGFKPKITGQHSYIPGFLDWAKNQNLDVRAHLLIWPGGGNLDGAGNLSGQAGNDYGNHLSTSSTSIFASHNVLGAVEAWAKASEADKPVMKARLEEEAASEIREWVGRWDVYEWDVINETLGNTLLQQILGWEQMAEWFRIARADAYRANHPGKSRYRETRLYINEFKIISAKPSSLDGGSQYSSRKNRYMERIDRVISDRGPISGIGFQSRFKYGLVDPGEVYDRLDEFANRYPELQLAGTEFEIKNGPDYQYTELERARMTEQLLTTFYSHRQVVGLNAWDFMSASVDPDPAESSAALAWYDGTVKLNGLVWYYLHRIRYGTDVVVQTGQAGSATVSAHKGEYTISVNHNGKSYAATLLLTDDSEITVTVDSGFEINAGLSDAWYNPVTDGQGFFITVFPTIGAVSLAWFTYDTELPAENVTAGLGDPGHRWLTALGPIEGSQAVMEIEMASGGLFDTATVIDRTDPPGTDGTIILAFTGCNSATVTYDIPSINRQGLVPIQRVANDNVVICEVLNSDP